MNFLQQIQAFLQGFGLGTGAIKPGQQITVPIVPIIQQGVNNVGQGVGSGVGTVTNGVTNGISDAITNSEKQFANTITTTETTIYNELKQGAIWAVLIIILAIGILGLVIGSGSEGNEIPIVVPA